VLRRWAAVVALAAPAALLGGCSRGMLDAHGPDAGRIATLWWLMFGIACFVFIAVLAFLAYALFHHRRGPAHFDQHPLSAMVFVLTSGAAIPLVLLIVVFGWTIVVMAETNTGLGDPLTIDVTGHDWWWEVHYPDGQFTTANEIHVPVGREVELKLTSDDVIHSFWVPQLSGKMDLIPGQTHSLYLEADDAGTYRGQCAEYCGIEHAHMAFYVIADEPAQFQQWVSAQQQPAFQPTDPQLLAGQQILLGSACVYCHAVRGTNASGTVGPDLTHLASRDWIGAGTLENNAENLSNWVRNPQDAKPGNAMPPTQLDDDSMKALVAYLQSLR